MTPTLIAETWFSYGSRLGECGHVFCQDCLTGWFQTLLARHRKVHPDYNVNSTPEFIPPAQVARYPSGIHPLFNAANHLPRPDYSCPTCRVKVTRRPCESYVIKKIVQLISKKTGEKAPHQPAQPTVALARIHNGRDKASQPGPWDVFFGA